MQKQLDERNTRLPRFPWGVLASGGYLSLEHFSLLDGHLLSLRLTQALRLGFSLLDRRCLVSILLLLLLIILLLLLLFVPVLLKVTDTDGVLLLGLD